MNAHGGPEGRPGCWQPVTRDLWPQPYLVMDTGASHRALQPLRTRSAHRHRIRLGTPDRGEHDQPMRITGTAIKLGAMSLVLLHVHRDHHRGVRPDAVRPHHWLLGGVQQRQWAARRPVRPRVRRRGRQGRQGRSSSTAGTRCKSTSTSTGRCRCSKAPPPSIRYLNLIGDRYLELKRGDDEKKLPPGGTIPIERTEPALDLDALIGGFRPLFRALDPDKVNNIAQSIITIFQGQGGTISDILDQTAQLTSAHRRPRPGDRRGGPQPQHRARHDGQASAAVRRDREELRDAHHRAEEPRGSDRGVGRRDQRRGGFGRRPAR